MRKLGYAGAFQPWAIEALTAKEKELSGPLLSTTLYVPRARANAVSCPRLTPKLLAGLRQAGSLALLAGPAGSGPPGRELVLIVDGYHVIRNQSIHNRLETYCIWEQT